MDNDTAIELVGVSKVYRLYDRPSDRLRESLHPFHKRYSRDFYALREVTLTIRQGETVGFIGRNGAGKSTLLKLITGVLTPTAGTLNVRGRIASLLELGAGFNPEMTGIENIYMNGTIMGLSRAEMDERLDDIVAFADIGEFIRQPVKMYSSGMFARVAFAVNAFVEPDILIVDEALSVGDAFFQAKCIDKMKHLLESGVTVLFVSHDWAAVKNLCQRGIVLEKGEVKLDGTASEAVEEYRRMQLDDRQGNLLPEAAANRPAAPPPTADIPPNHWFDDNAEFRKTAAYQRIQNGKLTFANVVLLDEAGNPVHEAVYGQTLTLRMAIEVREAVPAFGAGYHIRNEAGMELIYSDSKIERAIVEQPRAGSRYLLDWKFRAELREGKYNVAAVVSVPVDLAARRVECCDFVPLAVQFSILFNEDEMGGYVHWHNDVTVKEV